MQTLWTLARKDITLLFRDRFALFWIFAFPLMFSLFFGMLFSDGGDGTRTRIAILVVDDAKTEASKKLIQRLADHESLHVQRDEEGVPQMHPLEKAREAVRKGQKTAYVRIPADYGGGSLFEMFGPSEEGSAIEVGLDPTRSTELGFLQGILMQVRFSGMGELFQDRDRMLEEITDGRLEIGNDAELSATQREVLDRFMGSLETFFEDVDFGDAGGGSDAGGGELFDVSGSLEVVDVSREKDHQPRTAFDITFPSAIVWGLMGVAVAFASTLVRERTQGTLLRLRIAPIGRSQVLAGKAFACFLTCMIVMVFLLGFSMAFLGVRFDDYLLAVLALASTAACFTGVMMISAVMGKTEQAVAGASWGVMMPFAMIGGGMIPLIAMPPWLVKLSNFSPFKWGIYAIEGAAWRGFTLSDMLMPCLILVATGVCCFSIGVWRFQAADT